VLLYSQGLLTGGFHVPLWVVLSCQSAMALGTLCGGWRIVRTVGSRITHPDAQARILRGNWWGSGSVRRYVAGRSGIHHTYDHRLDCRRWVSAARFGRPLGCGSRHCGGMGRYAPGVRNSRGFLLLVGRTRWTLITPPLLKSASDNGSCER